MRSSFFILSVFMLSSCYKTLQLEGFDTNEWNSHRKQCSEYRIHSIDLLLENQDLLLESTQNEIESLLGAADEHELYARNQKFFHYRLTPHDSCSSSLNSIKFLSIRFNAIGRASDIQVIVRE